MSDFESDGKDEKLYKSIHNEYRHLVDSLINGFCQDLNVTVVQLVDVLKKRQVIFLNLY